MSRSLADDVVRGLRWSAFGRVIAQIFTWGASIFVIRLLTPEDYGLVTLSGIFVVYAGVISELGLGAALIQSRSRSPEVLSSAFGMVLALGCACSLTLIVCSGLIAQFFGEPRLQSLVQFAAIQFPVSVIGTIPYVRLSQDMRVREISLAGLIATIVQTVVTLLLAWFYPGPWALLIGTFANTVTRVTALNVFSPVACWPRFTIAPLRPLLRVSVFVFGERSLAHWYAEFDSFVVGKRLGTQEMGLYFTARQLAMLPLEKVMEVVNQVAFPAYAAANRDMEIVRSGYRTAVRVLAAYAFPVFWGLAAVAPDAVQLLLGDKWISAAVPTAVFSLAIPFRMLSVVSAPALLAIGRSDVSLLNLVRTFVLMIIATITGSNWGLVGVCIGWSIAIPIGALFAVRSTLRLLGIPWREYLARLRGPLCAAAVMAGLIEFAVDPLLGGESTSVRLAVDVFVGMALYWTGITMVDRSGRDEVLLLAKRVLRP